MIFKIKENLYTLNESKFDLIFYDNDTNSMTIIRYVDDFEYQREIEMTRDQYNAVTANLIYKQTEYIDLD